MRRYSFSYQTLVRFDSPVGRHDFLLRCLPMSNACQQVEEEHLHLLSPVDIYHSVDAFGNRIQYGCMPDRHDLFVCASGGTVMLDAYRLPEQEPAPVYRTAGRLTAVSDNMAAFACRHDWGTTPLQRALAMADALHTLLTYRPGSTTADTPAAEAFARQQGVCQDYAHLLAALCRHRGMAARYVAGFLLGEGATHAWTEIYSEGVWRGIDPTNNNLIEYGYIKVAQGRDAADCPVNRGLFVGKAGQASEVRVVTKEWMI